MFQLYLPVFSWLQREISVLISRSFDLVGMVLSGIDTPALPFGRSPVLRRRGGYGSCSNDFSRLRSRGFDPTATVGITVDSIPPIVLAGARQLAYEPGSKIAPS
jgi:hypothetical protein